MNIKVEQFKKKLEKLEKFIDNKEVFKEHELIEWIAACVSFFTEIGINNEIIRGFMKTFEFELPDENERLFSNAFRHKKIGPFKYNIDTEHKELGYEINSNSDFEFNKKPSKDIYYVRIAFVAAKAILQKEQREERIVPKFLILALSKNKKYSNLISSLELIEKSYQDKNADGLVKNSLTLLDSILNFDSKLKLKKPKGKLNCLIDNEDKRKKFGVSKDFVEALNNNRVIRNEEVMHKDLPLKYNIPFLVSLSFAHLVLLFLEITITTGKIIK